MHAPVTFRFDSNEHVYLNPDTGQEYPHITGMLVEAGYVNPRWFTEESRERGSAVHRMTADYDLGALEPTDEVVANSAYKGWLLAHVKAVQMIRPTFEHIEEPRVSRYGFGGRPDRDGLVYGAVSVVEIKSGGYEAAHPIQMALQAILVGEERNLPPEGIQRYCLYLKKNGKSKLEHFIAGRDFDEAYRLIRRFC